MRGHKEVCKLLVNLGEIDPFAANDSASQNPAQKAAAMGKLDVLRYFVDDAYSAMRGDLQATLVHGQTMLRCATGGYEYIEGELADAKNWVLSEDGNPAVKNLLLSKTGMTL
jgi:hypothetical protein